jgi:XTP/dITP diphosphohydrolase
LTARRPLLLATRSRGKLRELRPLLSGFEFDLLGLDDAGIVPDAAEDELERFDTFEENALAKARYFARLSGLPTVADDSGLEVKELGGRPGVHSKRWSGGLLADGSEPEERNRARLIQELANKSDRRARFVCAAAYVNGGEELVARGETYGVIIDRERGSGGFGYDPLFLSDDLGRTLAECSVEEKEKVSHRARAFGELARRIQSGR